MTTEEAIKQISGAEMILRNRDFEQFQTACIMAINALLAQQKLESNLKALERNDTLSLDELRQMDGEPVWCVSKILNKSEWAIVRINEMSKTWFIALAGASFAYGKEEYGDAWLAYRHKPEVDHD